MEALDNDINLKTTVSREDIEKYKKWKSRFATAKTFNTKFGTAFSAVTIFIPGYGPLISAIGIAATAMNHLAIISADKIHDSKNKEISAELEQSGEEKEDNEEVIGDVIEGLKQMKDNIEDLRNTMQTDEDQTENSMGKVA